MAGNGFVARPAGNPAGAGGVTALTEHIDIRPVQPADLDALEALEKRTFETDRLSRRSFRRWISGEHRAFKVATVDGVLAGYILIILHRGTRLARLYSIAVDSQMRGRGLGRKLIEAGEKAARAAGRIDMRLEVRKDNDAAIQLYEQLGYHRFGEYEDYYEDHQDAFRYQKRILQFDASHWQRPVPWYRQNTEFTCGPASLLMAMQALDKNIQPDISEEMHLWREATTIFMTSGHGGCHPLGLAIAARKRGFKAEVWISGDQILFIDSVRAEKKKKIIELAHTDFVAQAKKLKVPVHHSEVSQQQLTRALKKGGIPLILISTWQLDGKRVPHWVVLSAFDDEFFYLHDPDPEEGLQTDLDCQYLPIARSDFDRMARFGRDRLRTAVIISPGQ
ncbi:MAG: GNAT family N-acetyltransferase/peptidase C39 family protein [Alcanivoracaceae bacterium]|jgi:ribosomal protein S18 acetylase RimI-like enzyme|nr:GNAT family N-acetyltransferase/peptidase C39 family protein [Alcanivoracaceae bacterium]